MASSLFPSRQHGERPGASCPSGSTCAAKQSRWSSKRSSLATPAPLRKSPQPHTPPHFSPHSRRRQPWPRPQWKHSMAPKSGHLGRPLHDCRLWRRTDEGAPAARHAREAASGERAEPLQLSTLLGAPCRKGEAWDAPRAARATARRPCRAMLFEVPRAQSPVSATIAERALRGRRRRLGWQTSLAFGAAGLRGDRLDRPSDRLFPHRPLAGALGPDFQALKQSRKGLGLEFSQRVFSRHGSLPARSPCRPLRQSAASFSQEERQRPRQAWS